ncbi:MAG: DUF2269 family protein [Hydrogenophaga sp.]|uniref:DUF2269 family protein n=1 Tax=Hydrogenophaga sp. TaxID=1904254 RepID=UPI003D12B777
MNTYLLLKWLHVVSSVVLVGTGLLWLPVVWLQWRMATMAAQAVQAGNELPAAYWHFARWWERLGYPAFSAMLLVFVLMVFKPTFGI